MNKFNRGVTLISLTIYIIVFIITIGILNSITRYYMKNIDDVTISEKGEDQFNLFLTYINKDLNNKDLLYIKAGKEFEDDVKIKREYLFFKFKNDVQHIYMVEDGGLYFLSKEKNDSISNANTFDKIIILCKKVAAKENIDIFTYNNNILKIEMTILNNDYTTTLNTDLLI